MTIDKKTAIKIAKLARITVSEEKLDNLSEELSSILRFMEQLNEANVEGVKPMVSIAPMQAEFREDIVSDGNYRDKILKNAPHQSEGFFAVPKVIE
jgi:aspartyl-tRNA(Asn)/glutamyl-tRNA(Gln) amidotransferase subunit C